MRQFLLGLSISVAFILGCVTAQHVPELGMPTASAYEGQRWDYTCTEWPAPSLKQDKTLRSLEGHLDELGASGWELAPIPSGNATFLCFKRPQ